MIATRVAEPGDAVAISAILGEAFEGYRSWAPPDWAPPVLTQAGVARFADALGRSDVWCLLALDGRQVIGHVALSLFSMEDPEPPPVGMINLWQLFVTPAWQGRGIAIWLMEAAAGEARQRGSRACDYGRRRTRVELAASMSVKAGLLPVPHEDSPFGLPVVEYARTLDPPE